MNIQTPLLNFTRIFLLFSLFLASDYGFGQVVISGISPLRGAPGTEISISGSGFSPQANLNKVRIGGSNAEVISATTNNITVRVPAKGLLGPISVIVNGLLAQSQQSFITTFPGGTNSLHGSQFEPEIQYPLNSSTESVISVDIDGDQKSEMILSAIGLNGIYVFKNLSDIGKIQFGSPVLFSTGQVPWDVISGDFNGDGWNDLAVCNMVSRDIAILINEATGNIGFLPAIVLTAAKSPRNLAIGDFNLDGKLDIVVVNSDSYSIGIYRNTSSGGMVSFESPLVLNTGDTPWDVITGDLDGDGKMEIAVANLWDHNISVYRNTGSSGNLGFALPIQLPTGNNPRKLKIFDIDQDGKPEILNTNSQAQTLSVFRNTSVAGSISFAPLISVPVPGSAYDIEIADINGNGVVECMVSSWDYRTIFGYTSSPQPGLSFSPGLNFRPGSSFPDSISRNVKGFGFEDLDLDGKADLFSISGSSSAFIVSRNRVNEPLILGFSPHYGAEGVRVKIKGARFTGINKIRFGEGDAGEFSIISDSLIEATVGQMGSGRVSATNSGGTASLGDFFFRPVIDSIFPKSALTGKEVTIYGKGFHPSASQNQVKFGPVNAQVIFASKNQLKVLVPQGALRAPLSLSSSGRKAISKEWFSPMHQLPDAWFTGYSFQPIPIEDKGTKLKSVEVEDLNNDGKPDLVVLNDVGQNGISILQNNLDEMGLPWKISYYLKGSPFAPQIVEMNVEDLNGDGFSDLCFLVPSFNGVKIHILKNSGDTDSIRFEELEPIPTTYYYGSSKLALADINQDGRPDMVLYNGGYIFVYPNLSENETIKFGNTVRTNFLYGSSFLFLADYDDDGLIDIGGDSGSDLLTILNQSDQSNIKFSKSTTRTNLIRIPKHLEDLNGDNKPDFIAEFSRIHFAFIKNSGSPGIVNFVTEKEFVNPDNESGNSYSNYPFLGDLNGDGKPEYIAGSGNLIYKNTSDSAAINFDVERARLEPFHNSLILKHADLDLDGKPDLIGWHQSGLAYFKNKLAEDFEVKICPNTSFVEIPADIGGSGYQWQVKVDSSANFENIGENNYYSNVNAQVLKLKWPPTSFYGYTFRCISDGKYSREIKLKFEIHWYQNVEDNWYSSNWSCPIYPDENTDVIIEQGTIKINGPVTCRSLQAAPGAKIIVNPGGKLDIRK